MDRRTFLKGTAAGMTSAMIPFRPALAQAGGTLREGVYTDRQTYRAGVDALNVHVSLLDFTTVNIRVFQLDHLPGVALVADHDVPVDDTQTTDHPSIPTGGVGVFGPEFPARLSLDTTGWEPGLYMILIPQASLRPENQFNYSGHSSGPFLSQNFVCYFVVTAATLASYSNILWVHDSCTGMAYGGFGDESIYPGVVDQVHTATAQRPGIDRAATEGRDPLTKFKNDGYVFEFMDAMEYGNLSGPTPHELVVVCGQFEYTSNGFVSNLKAHVDGGANVLIAANEFAIFRTRVDAGATQMTTYKWEAHDDDPIGPPDLAGIGMRNEHETYENEVAGLNLWSAWNTGFTDQDMQITNYDDTGFLFEGTGFVDTIPAYINGFSMGNRGSINGDDFNFMDVSESRTPADTIAWAASPSTNARDWADGDDGVHPSVWPIDPDGHALCTLRETNLGARAIGMSSNRQLADFLSLPGYDRLAENIMAWVSQDGPIPTPAVPTWSPLAVGALTGGLVATASRFTGARPEDEPDDE